MTGTEEIDIKAEQAWEQRYANIRKSFDTALYCKQVSNELNYSKGVADASKILGYCYWRFSDYQNSLEHSLQAQDLYRDLDDKNGEADTLNSIGAVYMFQKDNQKRLECNLRCLELRQEVKAYEDIPGTLNNIGETYFEMGDMENASIWFEQCFNSEYVTPEDLGWTHHNLGKVHESNDDFGKARQAYEASIHITKKIEYHVLTCETLAKLCRLLTANQEYSLAEEYGLEGLRISEDKKLKESSKDLLQALASLKEKTNLPLEALEYHKQYHHLYVELFNADSHQRIKDVGFQYELDKVNEIAKVEKEKNLELAEANEEIESRNQEIHMKNKDITDSILYAHRIQMAVLKSIDQTSTHLPEHSIFFKPRDIVSGDFYWSIEKDGYLYVAVADCTGHGVPGAFLTLLGTSFLNEIALQEEAPTPAIIMMQLRAKFIAELNDTSKTFRDGMDLSMIRLELATDIIDWTGAISPLWILKAGNEKIDRVSGDKQSICFTEEPEPFSSHRFKMDPGDQIFMFTDGYADQFGGPKGKKMNRVKMLSLFENLKSESTSGQRNEIIDFFNAWKKEEWQVDDVCVFIMKF
jgi:serine phosphatase RsbU (regulator of sigma subunit)